MDTVERKIPSQFPRFPGRCQYRVRFCQQYEKETLPEFFRWFLQLKAQALEVLDEQVIKALRAGQLHSYLVRERPKMLEELYEEFEMFSRAEVLHFRKLGQQRKAAIENESSRPFKYSKTKEVASSFNVMHKQVHSIDLDGCGPLENWEKNSRPLRQESQNRVHDPRRDHQQTRGGYSSRGRGWNQEKHLYCMFHENQTQIIGQEIAPFSWNLKRRWLKSITNLRHQA
jgi:hypothetical protein